MLELSDMEEKTNKCENKMSFDTEKQAQTAATVAEHQRGVKIKPYHCQKCGLWHNATRYKD